MPATATSTRSTAAIAPCSSMRAEVAFARQSPRGRHGRSSRTCTPTTRPGRERSASAASRSSPTRGRPRDWPSATRSAPASPGLAPGACTRPTSGSTRGPRCGLSTTATSSTSGGCRVTVVATPGHAAGHISLLVEADGRSLVAGDLVFPGGTISLQVMPDCSIDSIWQSIERCACSSRTALRGPPRAGALGRHRPSRRGARGVPSGPHPPGPRLMRRLEGRAAVITGGCNGIGRAIAERFVAEGARSPIGQLGAGSHSAPEGCRAVGARRARRGRGRSVRRTAAAEFRAAPIAVSNAAITGPRALRPS